MKRMVRRYETSAAIDDLDFVYEVQDLAFATAGPGTITPAGDVELAGVGPLPQPGTIMITIVDAEV